jgi:hypothetical protein
MSVNQTYVATLGHSNERRPDILGCAGSIRMSVNQTYVATLGHSDVGHTRHTWQP